MKRLQSAFALILFLTAPAFSLSDSEYLRMRKSSSDFARADKRLNQVWAGLKKSLPKKIFSQLDTLQREWVASGRDDEAAALMDDGYSRMEAYTMATNDRADSLPKIAESLRKSRNNASTPEKPKPAPKPAARVPEPEPESPLDERPETIDGEYQNDNGFVMVRILDASTDEVEVTFSRFKDGVHWTAKGWIDGDTLELSDRNYSECQATLKFSGKTLKVETTRTDDWKEATAPDFVLEGTYMKLAN